MMRAGVIDRSVRARSGGAGAEPVRVKLGPLCMVVPVAELEAWVVNAAPGERFTYARGQALAQAERTVIVARDYAAAGLVLTLQRVASGADGRRETEWFVQRRAAEPVKAAPVPVAAPAPDAEALFEGPDGEAMEAIARAFSRAASLKLVAPTNAELADMLHIPDPAKGKRRVRYLVGKLISAGVVRITDNGPRARRIVTIAATGKSTVAGRL